MIGGMHHASGRSWRPVLARQSTHHATRRHDPTECVLVCIRYIISPALSAKVRTSRLSSPRGFRNLTSTAVNTTRHHIDHHHVRKARSQSTRVILSFCTTYNPPRELHNGRIGLEFGEYLYRSVPIDAWWLIGHPCPPSASEASVPQLREAVYQRL